jgi:predicted nucleotidyltransferase
MTLNTERLLFMEIWLNPGIHVRELSRRLKIGIPSVKYGLNKLNKVNLIFSKLEGRNLKFFVNLKASEARSYLFQVENHRIQTILSREVRNAIYDLLKLLDTKPLITIVFGSCARGDYFPKESDVDVLLVFDKKEDKNLAQKASIISSRYCVRLSPVFLNWVEFGKKFYNTKDIFMKQLKENKIIFLGLNWWLELENEST